ncbi:MAG: LysR family transcriptional regulator [Proteobacteria bacterium]|nr:LysR family transcriptional regulator [Pseudomonadota bacterium]
MLILKSALQFCYNRANIPHMLASELYVSLKQARCIVAIGEEGNLGRASERLAMSQSSLSRHLADAEQKLGQRLFQRGWTGMEPTTCGEIAVTLARRMMSAIQQAEGQLRETSPQCRPLALHLNWQLLATITAVADLKGASPAAARLGVTQPVVSRGLAQVEAIVGTRLFIRGSRDLQPAPGAMVLCELYRDLRARASQLKAAVTGMEGQLAGRVAVGILPFSEQDLVIQAFGRMQKLHPHVRLQGITGSFQALADSLLRGEIDVIIGPLRESAFDGHLEKIELFQEMLAFVGRADHPLAGKRADIRELLGYPFVVGPQGSPPRLVLEELLTRHGLGGPSQVCEMITFTLAEHMVAKSDAIGLLSYSARKLEDGLSPLHVIETHASLGETMIGLVRTSANSGTPEAKVFTAMVQDMVRAGTWLRRSGAAA